MAADPTSYANFSDFKVLNYHLDLAVDFESRQLLGSVTLSVEVIKPSSEIILDTRDLAINGVKGTLDDKGKPSNIIMLQLFIRNRVCLGRCICCFWPGPADSSPFRQSQSTISYVSFFFQQPSEGTKFDLIVNFSTSPDST